jgi:immune inhibitor A
MCDHREQLAGLHGIYAAARASDDGQRCMVAPHPDLLLRVHDEVSKLRDSQEGVLRSMMRVSEPQRPGLNDGTLRPEGEFPLGAPPSLIRNAALNRAAPLRGTVRVIVVLVEFPDQRFDPGHDLAHFKRLFFSNNSAGQKSVRDYYREVTNDLVQIEGEVVGPYLLPNAIATYAHGASGIGAALPNAQTMAFDAAVLARHAVDFSPYDNDHDGYVDAYVIVHAGLGGEVTGNPHDIWSHKWVFSGGPLPVNSTKLYAYLTVPEDAKIGVCCHELGHLLFGFPDLYDPDYSSHGVGNWCLMAGGSWGGGGDVPTHPSAWCKANQGWVAVDNPTSNGSVRLEDVKSSHRIQRLWRNGAASTEYFLLENRQQTQFDASLPGHGLLIWHIDENIAGNSNELHYKVALLQADGRNDLAHPPSPTNRGGDQGDPFPGATANTKFGDNTRPNSKAYNGQPTGVSVTQISEHNGVVTAQVQVRQAAAPWVHLASADGSSGSGLSTRVAALESEVQHLRQIIEGGEAPAPEESRSIADLAIAVDENVPAIRHMAKTAQFINTAN